MSHSPPHVRFAKLPKFKSDPSLLISCSFAYLRFSNEVSGDWPDFSHMCGVFLEIQCHFNSFKTVIRNIYVSD